MRFLVPIIIRFCSIGTSRRNWNFDHHIFSELFDFDLDDQVCGNCGFKLFCFFSILGKISFDGKNVFFLRRLWIPKLLVSSKENWSDTRFYDLQRFFFRWKNDGLEWKFRNCPIHRTFQFYFIFSKASFSSHNFW